MSLLNGSAVKAREVIDFCMANESPELKAKVFEIISRSELEPNDPMFMALLLTGQMRVLIEAAPEGLNRLLSEWKQESASSLSEITEAISLVAKQQQRQAETIEENMEAVSNKCVSDIKEAGMGTVGAIADASSENFEQLQRNLKQIEQLESKVTQLDAKFDEREQKSIENMNALIRWVNKTTQKQEAVNHQVDILISEVGKIKRKKVWLRIADAFWSLPALVACMLIAMGGTWWIASR
ncbi:hypothetical protein I4641_16245 [Waterburya agarophytonicola K14]|uniref:Uncharacterized protein n=1 Tax=Waterburya agarophytonicola KI4 TaxID=2874699 RepID=A0A964FGY6_9CYAN|nr:DUF6753 family protein [Waterburya agarophytonicola]MCC0178527.1 hypothetical protein [Waterburya agarophytonicola KI4]